jgi:hypothetical protein
MLSLSSLGHQSLFLVPPPPTLTGLWLAFIGHPLGGGDMMSNVWGECVDRGRYEGGKEKRQMKVKRRSNPCIWVYQGNWRRLGAAT